METLRTIVVFIFSLAGISLITYGAFEAFEGGLSNSSDYLIIAAACILAVKVIEKKELKEKD